MKDDGRNIGYYLQRARWDCNKSQEFMAIELGIARKTVQNWERGYSEPTLSQMLEWFEVLKLNPMPYVLRIFYHDAYVADSADDKKTRNILIDMIKDMPIRSVKQFLYVIDGNHGSSPKALLQMMTAHLQTPMKDRYNQASLIYDNYLIAKEKGELAGDADIQPDEEFLKKAIEEGRKSVITGNEEYSML